MPIPLAIRPMQERHLDAVLALEYVSFPTPWPRSLYERELRRNQFSQYFVIVPTQATSSLPSILGQGGFWRMGEEAHIVTIAVHPDWRGHGLGKWLLLTLIQKAREAGSELITLEVRPSNEAALALYKNVGFVPVGERKHYYPNGEDALILELAGLHRPEIWRPLQEQLDQLNEKMAAGVAR